MHNILRMHHTPSAYARTYSDAWAPAQAVIGIGTCRSPWLGDSEGVMPVRAKEIANVIVSNKFMVDPFKKKYNYDSDFLDVSSAK